MANWLGACLAEMVGLPDAPGLLVLHVLLALRAVVAVQVVVVTVVVVVRQVVVVVAWASPPKRSAS